MAEYEMKRQNRQSRVVANCKTVSRQLKEIMDNRIIQRTFKNEKHQINSSSLRKVSQLLCVQLSTNHATVAATNGNKIAEITEQIKKLYGYADDSYARSCAADIINGKYYKGQKFIYTDDKQNGKCRCCSAGSFCHCTVERVTAFWKNKKPSFEILMVGTHFTTNQNYKILGATNNDMVEKIIAFDPHS